MSFGGAASREAVGREEGEASRPRDGGGGRGRGDRRGGRRREGRGDRRRRRRRGDRREPPEWGGAGIGAAKVAGLSLFAKIGIGVAAATISVGGVIWSRAHDETSRPVPAVTASSEVLASNGPVAPSREAPSAGPSATTDTASAAPGGSEKPTAQAPRNPSFATAEPTAEAVDPLQEEAKLLAAAHAELSRGNAGAALVILDQHAARFPRGTLAPERRATRAMALCKAGRTDEGKRELAALYGADSKSPMAQKIDRACGK